MQTNKDAGNTFWWDHQDIRGHATNYELQAQLDHKDQKIAKVKHIGHPSVGNFPLPICENTQKL